MLGDSKLYFVSDFDQQDAQRHLLLPSAYLQKVSFGRKNAGNTSCQQISQFKQAWYIFSEEKEEKILSVPCCSEKWKWNEKPVSKERETKAFKASSKSSSE